jgi:curved DNA-binding protein CbpA
LEEAHTVLSDPARREIYLLIRRGLASSGLGSDVERRARPSRGRLRLRKRWILLLAVLAAAAVIK